MDGQVVVGPVHQGQGRLPLRVGGGPEAGVGIAEPDMGFRIPGIHAECLAEIGPSLVLSLQPFIGPAALDQQSGILRGLFQARRIRADGLFELAQVFPHRAEVGEECCRPAAQRDRLLQLGPGQRPRPWTRGRGQFGGEEE